MISNCIHPVNLSWGNTILSTLLDAVCKVLFWNLSLKNIISRQNEGVTFAPS